MHICPQCKAEVVGNSSTCAQCGIDLSLEFESTQLSSDVRSREPTEVMSAGNPTELSGPFSPGTVLAGRYRLITSIGKGGMGEVYKAEDLELNQTVALKFLPAAIAKDAAALSRFRSEVRIARQVSHPNVCRVFDIAEADGVYFISMEYIEGDDLSMLLRRIGRLPSDKAVEIARQLCLGLHAIHDAGILHRDLKPANIIIDSRGKARITDFGIAGVEAELTRDDFRSGTPGYMSPEQFDGQSVTQKSDIYSLGLLLYEIFTGKQAIQFESLPELIHKHQTTSPTNPSEILEDIDPMVEKTILRCLEKEPDDRPVSALQVALMLPGGNPLEAAIAADETPSPEMVAAAPKKGALSVGIAGAGFAAVVLLFIAFTLLQDLTHITVGGERSSEVLASRSREIAVNLGYTEPPDANAYSHASDPGFMFYAIHNPNKIADPGEVVKSGWSRSRYFRYRQSPNPLWPRALIWVSRDDPPFDVPGMARVLTDATGRLIAFEAVPMPRSDPSGEKKEVDWSRLFTEAGLDLSNFTPAAPELIPIVYAEEHLAWTGRLPIDPAIELRVEAAAYDGRPVYFRIAAPWDDPADPNQYSGDGPPTAISIFIPSVIILVFVGLFVLSWYNHRNKRTDLQGSLRVLAVVFVIGAGGRLVTADHTSFVLGELWLLSNLFSSVLFYAVITGLIYSALEPHIRRSWPEALISWSRLLIGDFRSPMIGRDILFGMLLGILTTVLISGSVLLTAPSSVRRIPLVNYNPKDHVYWAGADLLNIAALALLIAFMAFFVLFVFRLVFRRRWLALAVFGSLNVLVAATSLRPGPEFGPDWYIALFGGLLGLIHFSTFWITIARFGVLGLIAYIFTVTVIGIDWPFTFNRGDIYFAISTFTLLVFTAIAGYASYLATGGRTPEIGKILEASAEENRKV